MNDMKVITIILISLNVLISVIYFKVFAIKRGMDIVIMDLLQKKESEEREEDDGK